jgi:hypothetical protein
MLCVILIWIEIRYVKTQNKHGDHFVHSLKFNAVYAYEYVHLYSIFSSHQEMIRESSKQ